MNTAEHVLVGADYSAGGRRCRNHPWGCAQPWAEQSQRWLAQALAGWRDKYPDVDLRTDAVKDHTVAGRVSASAGHDLLVVGSHSRRRRLAPLLGSVSQGVLHHARCPVAVVHPHEAGSMKGEDLR
ncbi:MAG TPA: universal stress protein [Jatrophihabitans sp.]|nr:universal stress protein [Jatrophihabitans sp.]